MFLNKSNLTLVYFEKRLKLKREKLRAEENIVLFSRRPNVRSQKIIIIIVDGKLNNLSVFDECGTFRHKSVCVRITVVTENHSKSRFSPIDILLR